MDDVEIQPAVPNVLDIESGSKWPKRKIILIAGISILVILSFILGLLFLYPKKSNSISKSTPATLNLSKGNLTSIEGTNINVSVYGKLQTFSIANTQDFQKTVSGSVEAGDIQVESTTVSELKVGQEVLVIAQIGSSAAKTVYILR